jgi:RNase P subunit RPR2
MKVVLTPEQLVKQAEDVVKKAMFEGKKYCRNRTCRGCGGKKIKPVAMHEDLNPLFPSKIIIYCPDCGYNFVFADARDQKARDYKKELEKAGFKEAPKDLADKLIITPKE